MHHRRTTTRLAAVGFTLALLLAACGSSSGSDPSSDSGDKGSTTAAPSSDSGGSSKDLKITIKGFKFMPEDLKAKVGDTITVTNEDSATHTATSADGDPSEFDTGRLKEGDSKEIKVTKAGTYEYDCEIHDYMKGTIEVS